MSVHKDEQAAKSGKTAWYVKYNNKTFRGFKTKTEAKQYEAKIKLGLIENVETDNISFHALATDYLEEMRSNDNAYGTYDKCRNVVDNIIIPNTKNKKLAKITIQDCRSFRTYVKNSDYSTFTKNYIIEQYKSIFKHGEKAYHLTSNPSKDLSRFKKTQEDNEQMKAKEQEIWTPEEFNQFFNYIDKEEYKPLFMILYWTGARLGEVLCLRWSDITDDHIIHITKSLTTKTDKGAYEIKSPKTYTSIRDISSGNKLYEYLMEYKSKQRLIQGFKESWFICGGIRPLPTSTVNRVKDRAVKKSGVKRIKTHSIRHSHASWLLNNGINIVSVSRRLGHSSISITLSVYAHLFKDIDQKMLNFIDESFDQRENKGKDE